jgi:5-methylcytosine-specific restriction protein A
VVRTQRYCDAHRKSNTARINRERQANPVKRQRNAFYDSKAWRDLRAWQLAEHPLCAHCELAGLLVSATVADHIIERKNGGAELDSDNLQSLCASCHGKKTRRDGGAW